MLDISIHIDGRFNALIIIPAKCIFDLLQVPVKLVVQTLHSLYIDTKFVYHPYHHVSLNIKNIEY